MRIKIGTGYLSRFFFFNLKEHCGIVIVKFEDLLCWLSLPNSEICINLILMKTGTEICFVVPRTVLRKSEL